jgi:hypothetical protein
MPSPDLKTVTATWKTPLPGDLWKKLESLKTGASEQGDFLTLGPTFAG